MSKILREPIFEKAFHTAELAAMDLKEREKYEADLKIYRDNYAVLKTAHVEGFDEGKLEEKHEIARKMKKDGLEIDFITKYTGLSVEEIEHLK